MESTYSKDDILQYLALPLKNNGRIIKSPHIACLQDAREETARDINTGEKDKEKRHASWLGALAYMVLVDHIGNKFEYKNEEKKEKIKRIGYNNDFINTLIYFSNLGDDEVLALYALRCSFTHDYFLFNINENEPNLSHHFSVTAGEQGLLVTLPKEKWNGDMELRGEENKTIVNLELFGDLVEKIHSAVVLGIQNETVNIRKGARFEYITYIEM